MAVEEVELPSLRVSRTHSSVSTRLTAAGVGQKKVVQAQSMCVPPTPPTKQRRICT